MSPLVTDMVAGYAGSWACVLIMLAHDAEAGVFDWRRWVVGGGLFVTTLVLVGWMCVAFRDGGAS